MIRGFILGVAGILGLGFGGCWMPGRSYSGSVDISRPQTQRLAVVTEGLERVIAELAGVQTLSN